MAVTIPAMKIVMIVNVIPITIAVTMRWIVNVDSGDDCNVMVTVVVEILPVEGKWRVEEWLVIALLICQPSAPHLARLSAVS